MELFVVQEGKPVKLEKTDYGSFFSDEIYILDLKGKKHRYVLTWMGPKLDEFEISKTSGYMGKIVFKTFRYRN